MLKNHQHISLMEWLFYSVSMIQPFKRSMTWVSVSGKKITTLMGKEVNSCVVIVFDRYDHQHSVKDLERKEAAPFTPADEHISSQDKQVFQTLGNSSGSVETRLLYVALSAPTSPVLGQREFLQGTLSSWQVALKMVKRLRRLASQALTAWKIFTVTRRRLTRGWCYMQYILHSHILV